MSSTGLTEGESTREVGEPCGGGERAVAMEGASVAEPTSEVGLREEGADKGTGREEGQNEGQADDAGGQGAHSAEATFGQHCGNRVEA